MCYLLQVRCCLWTKPVYKIRNPLICNFFLLKFFLGWVLTGTYNGWVPIRLIRFSFGKSILSRSRPLSIHLPHSTWFVVVVTENLRVLLQFSIYFSWRLFSYRKQNRSVPIFSRTIKNFHKWTNNVFFVIEVRWRLTKWTQIFCRHRLIWQYL